MPFDIAASRLAVSFDYPYYQAALWSLHVVPVKNPEGLLKGTMAVDKYWRLYHDADLDVTPKQGRNMLIHELGHLLREHHDRASHIVDFQPMAWQFASDFEINDDLVNDPKLVNDWPFPVLEPGKFGLPDNQLAETYYSELLKHQPKCTCPQPNQQGKPQEGEGGQEGQGSKQQQQAQGDQEQGDTSGQGTEEGGGSCPVHRGTQPRECGSGAHGQERPWDLGAPSKKNPGISSGQAELIKRKVANDVVEFSQTPKGRGTVPGGWLRWAENVLKPSVPWQKLFMQILLRARMTAMQRVDYSFARPNRRSHSTGFIMPRLMGPDINTGVVVDTSGSVDNTQLGRALTELGGLIKKFQNVTVYSVDAAVHAAKRVSSDPRKIELIGGGGTDMMMGINHAAKQKHDVVVCITDAICPWDEIGPRIPTVVVVIDNPNAQIPRWAHVVHVNSREEQRAA